jgi:peptidoglycan/LPS O-acetylase OafA/YrhL
LKSSSGKYYVALDHVRALAIFVVFTWHFVNINYGAAQYNTPVPIFPLSLLMEGHTGVAIFMTLSGYLFAKLLDGKDINYKSFIWNRCIRLLPLLGLVILFVGVQAALAGGNIQTYINTILNGALHPTLPNGGWSITVEFHFYLVLPLILWISRKSKYSLACILLLTMLFRNFLHHKFGEVQTLSYFTILGRIDQFVLGIMACQLRQYFTRKHWLAAGIFCLFALLYRQFDIHGGFYNYPAYPSPSQIWIYLPTIEGMAYASMIAWYDTSFKHSTGLISRFIAAIGTYSYSIYLLHFFFVNQLAIAIGRYVNLSNIYLALLASLVAFLTMVPIGYISYRFIELPFCKFRVKYIREVEAQTTENPA